MNTKTSYRFGICEILTAERRLLINGIEKPLGGRAFDLLLALVEQAGRTVSKNELLGIVWPKLFVEENNLQVQVSALRKMLGSEVIATVPGLGYRFTASLDARDEVPRPIQADVTQEASVVSGTVIRKPPARLSRLLGRDFDVTSILLMIREHRLVTIVGAGGIGKTHLAQSIANAMQTNYADGVAWIELASLSEPSLIESTVALALGVPLTPNCPPLDSLIAALQTRSLVMVLDNAEHLFDAVAQFVAAMCASTSDIRFLVTSQQRLNLPGEHVYRLTPLALPDEEICAGEALEYGAVALFVARVQSLDRRFMLTESNVGAVIDICRRLDGIPLALELAAARLPMLGLKILALRLDERLRLLTAGGSVAPLRHQTLLATFEWSYGLLSEQEQSVFRRLGIFVGGFTLADLTPVVRTDDSFDELTVIDILSNLVERSLVGVDDTKTLRYSLFESARVFALAKLDAAGEGDMLRRSHLFYYRDQADLARIGFYTQKWPQHREWLKANYGNLRAALEWSLGAAADVVNGSVIAIALHHYWYEYEHTDEQGHWMALAHQHLDRLSPLIQVRLLLTLGTYFRRIGDYDQAELHLSHCIALSASMESAQVEWADACNDLAIIKNGKNAYNEARLLFEQALAVQRTMGSRKSEAAVLHNIAHSCFGLGEVPQAEELFLKVLTVAREERDGLSTAAVLIVLAECAFEQGRLEQAIERGREAIALQRHFGDTLTLANWLQRFSKYELASARPDAARAALAEALGMCGSAPPPLFVIQFIDNCVNLALAEGKVKCAARLLGFNQAWCTARNLLHSPLRQRQADALIADVCLALGEDAYAAALAEGLCFSLEDALALVAELVGEGPGGIFGL